MTQREPNRLIHETSPYLRQHAFNPVDWHPWGPEAFEKAAREDKPVFLSIGYSSCHWCHVMEHESFENEEVAGILREDFISIKVDREEHPDVDALYMTATQLMTGRGGWPNSVWLMPDKRPWYAGTYFPCEDRAGRIGFKSLLRKLAGVWKSNRSAVEEQASALMDAIRSNNETRPGNEDVLQEPEKLSRMIQQHYRDQFDPRHGGFGTSPKFPPHSGILLLLQTLEHAPSPETETVITTTLDAMMRGGIYDHVVGGFHRYATDEQWLVPHFEKMLYDNAMLVKAYALAARRFDREDYRRIVRQTAHWILCDMTHPDGGFFSALDADSDGEEGLYYTWTMTEIIESIGHQEAERFSRIYQILPGGNYSDESTGMVTGRNIPHVHQEIPETEIAGCAAILQQLRSTRNKRIKPMRDEKIITGWNALMIGALATAGKTLNDPTLLDAAQRARNFIRLNLEQGARLIRCWCEGSARHEAVLEDYAALAIADLDLHDATGNSSYLDGARATIDMMLRLFHDPESEMLFMTGPHAVAGIRLQDVYDQGTPAGLGLAVESLIRYGIVTGEKRFQELGRSLCRGKARAINRSPSAVASMIAGYLHTFSAEAPLFDIRFSGQANPSHRAQATIKCRLPPGYKLNSMITNARTVPIRIRWADAATGIEMELNSGDATDAWRVVFSSEKQLRGRHTLLISYQLCTASECRPVEEAGLSVDFGG